MKDWTSAERIGKIAVSVINVLAKEFHKEANKPEGEKDWKKIISLSQANGYQCQLYSALQKSHEYEFRLQKVERTIKNATPESLALGLNPVIAAEEEIKTQSKYR